MWNVTECGAVGISVRAALRRGRIRFGAQRGTGRRSAAVRPADGQGLGYARSPRCLNRKSNPDRLDETRIRADPRDRWRFERVAERFRFKTVDERTAAAAATVSRPTAEPPPPHPARRVPGFRGSPRTASSPRLTAPA